MSDDLQLEHSHQPDAIIQRLAQPNSASYLRDAVYGAIDGAVTTFAIVSGVAGAGLAAKIVIILGIANLIGDGFSMAAANFLGTRAENQRRRQLRAIERKHIEVCPSGEQEEIRQILIQQGYQGELLDKTIEHITGDEEAWVRTMLEHEYGVSGPETAPLPAALTTLVSFVVVGALPLIPFIAEWVFHFEASSFTISTVTTGVAFFIVGSLKSRYVEQHWLTSGLETLIVGALAAGLAFACGYLLSDIA